MRHAVFIGWLIPFLLGLWHQASAQVVTVKDLSTSKLIEGVAFSVSNQLRVYTDVEGKCFLGKSFWHKTISIKKEGYRNDLSTMEALSKKNFLVLLIPLKSDIEEVVISASKWNQSAIEVPRQIAIITSKDNEFYHPQTSADLIGNSGKVFIQKSQQGGGSPMIRGFAANRLLYSVDGVRMNTAIFRSGNVQNVINLDPFAMEKVEVLFGPGSVAYGSDAIGGVMSFQTLNPQMARDKPYIFGNVNTRFSTANKEKVGHFDLNIGLKSFAFLTSFSAWDFDHLRQGSRGPQDYIKSIHVKRQDTLDVIINQNDPLLQIPSGYRQVNFMQKIRFKPNEYFDMQYAFHYSNTSSFGRYDRHNRFINGLPRYAEWDYGPQSWLMHQLSLNYRKASLLFDNLAIRLALQQFGESRIDRSLNNNNRTIQSEKVDAFSVNLDLLKRMGVRNTLFYGFEFVSNEVSSSGSISNILTGSQVAGPSRYPTSKWNSLAAYANYEMHASERLTLQSGLRFNYYSLQGNFSNNLNFYPFPFQTVDLNNNALTGSIGAVYKVTRTWILRGNLGTAFRSPNVDDVGKVFDSEPGALTVPNVNLMAEYAYNADLGILKSVGDKFKIELNVFYTYLNNAMVRRPFTLDGKDSILYDGQMSQVQAIQNAAMAKVYGGQMGFEVKLPIGFKLSGDFNYQKGEEELDNGDLSASRHAAPFFGLLRLNYSYKKWRVEAYGFYQAERKHEHLAQEEQAKVELYAKDASGKAYSPQWYTLNFKAMLQLNKSFVLSAGIENITDQRYRPYSSGISGAGRNVVLAVRAGF